MKLRKSSFQNIINYGSEFCNSPIDLHRVTTLNYLIAITFVLNLIIPVVLFFTDNKEGALFCISVQFITVPILFLNKIGKLKLARIYFISIACILIFLSSTLSTFSLKSIDSVNILYVIMIIVLFIFDGTLRNIVYLIVFFLLLYIKYLSAVELSKVMPTNEEFNNIIVHIVVNNFIIASILFIHIRYIINFLVKTINKSKTQDNILNVVLDNIPLNIALIDKEYKFVLVNGKYADKYNLDKQEIIGKPRKEILPIQTSKKHQNMIERSLKGEIISTIEKGVTVQGKEISNRYKFIPIDDGEESSKYVAICCDDVSELIKIQNELQSINTTKDKVFSIIAHDIRSPLNLFESILNVSKDGIITPEEFMTYQENVRDKLKSVTNTIDSMLTWAKMQLGGISANPSQVNVCKTSKQIVPLFKSVILEKNINFKLDTLGFDNITAWVDENHLTIIIRNILHNALKFTPKDKSVSLEIENGNPSVLIRIRDEGVGMPPDVMNAILTKQVQASKAGTEQEKGTGLGLSLAIGLVEENHCGISVDSEEGVGTVFEISLPKNKPV